MGRSLLSFRDPVKDCASHFSRCQWEPRDEDNSAALTIVHEVIPLAICKTVAILHRNDGHNLPGTLDMLFSDIGQSDEANLALLSYPGQCFHGEIKRHRRIRRVQ